MNHHELHEAIDRTIGRSKLRSTPPVVLIAGDHRSPQMLQHTSWTGSNHTSTKRFCRLTVSSWIFDPRGRLDVLERCTSICLPVLSFSWLPQTSKHRSLSETFIEPPSAGIFCLPSIELRSSKNVVQLILGGCDVGASAKNNMEKFDEPWIWPSSWVIIMIIMITVIIA